MIQGPFLTLALLYAIGVAVADVFTLPLPGLLISCWALALAALIPWRGRPFMIACLLILLGFTNHTRQTAVLSPHDLRTLAGDRFEEATVRGRLCRTPAAKITEHGSDVSWRTVAELETESIRFAGDAGSWQPGFGRVTVSTRGILTSTYFAGQQVEIVGRLSRPKQPVAEGLFDYRNYLKRLGIYYQLEAASTNAWKSAENRLAVPPLADRFIGWGKAALARGLPVEDEALRLEWALTLGVKTALTEEVSEPFIHAATYHIFAVDGLRIAIISGIFLNLLRVFGFPRAVAGLLVLPLIWFYAGLTGFQASAIRATVMATVVIGGWALKRPKNHINSLCAAALIILIWEPAQLFQAGFQLSFCVVFCIILLMPPLEKAAAYFFKPDPLLPDELRPRWQKMLRRPGRYLRDTLLVSLAAWLGSIPLAACYFNILTPVSPPANLLAVPLCGLVLICNLISLLLAGWLPIVPELYNHAGWFLMECIRVSSHWSARWPGAYYYVTPPNLFTTVLYYLLLLTILTGWVFQQKQRGWIFAGLALLTTVWGLPRLLELPEIRLTVLPVNGAGAIYVDGPGRAKDMLVDCGPEKSTRWIIKPFLQAHGVNGLARLLFTQGDVNHVGGCEIIRQQFSPSEIDISSSRSRSAVYRRVLENIQSKPGLVKIVQRGDSLPPWQVLHPSPEDHFPQADDNALVLQGELRGTRVLLLSNLSKPGQNALFNHQPDLRAEIVVAALPQQSEALAEALLDAIQPRLIIISDSEYPSSARASRKLRERLARRRIQVVYTSEAGAVTLCFKRHGWLLKTMNPPVNLTAAPEKTSITEDESE